MATANREITCINKYEIFPPPQGIFSGPGQYKPTATAKISTLHDYLKVAKYLLPKDKKLHSAILWHTDLHTDNIFVDPNNPTQIVSIIDWQSAHISPLFLQARHSALLEFEGSITENFDIKVPENFDTLSPEEQEKAKSSGRLNRFIGFMILLPSGRIEKCIKLSGHVTLKAYISLAWLV